MKSVQLVHPRASGHNVQRLLFTVDHSVGIVASHSIEKANYVVIKETAKVIIYLALKS
jgi:hypothetical protein